MPWRPQDVLIVLDNCEHLIGGCAKTADAIVRRCPRVHLLATSREPLGIGGETIYRVPSLSLPGPGDVRHRRPGHPMRSRCSRTGPGPRAYRPRPLTRQTAPLVVSICRRLDGMPLAIELAAARLRSMSLAELHDRLDQRFRLLTGGSRTALARQQTLRATVDWSYSLLTGAEQVLLAAPVGVRRTASTWTPPRRSAASVTSTCSRWPSCSGRWWTRAWCVAEPAADRCGTGCWRPSASSPPSG